ncbi:hypothetical protein [Pyrococcus kukulkanii]|uniref:hypothetical protein n=1 Tax=Pyrococcus kukulkanii TaxID=1609559 RepID=UPI0035624168
MAVEKIIVMALTYPELSKKHGPIVCVAGVNEYGEWRRLYPLPFKIWSEDDYKNIKFHKWDVIEVDVEKARHDPRKESMRVKDWRQIKVVGHIEDWSLRLSIVQELLDPDIETIVKSGRSLGVIKPREILDFYAKPRQRLKEDAEKLVLEKMEEADSTVTLLEYLGIKDEHLLPEVKEPDTKIEKLPWIGYRFYCRNPQCRGHEMMVIDWEAQELFRKYKVVEGPVKEKLFNYMVEERDLYFIVGNTWKYHKSFMIIGLFYPPKGTKTQKTLIPLFKKRAKPKTLDNFILKRE